MIYRMQVQREERDKRLDLYLADQTGLSRTTLRKIIELGGVHINGRRIRKCGLLLQEKQRIELHQDGRPLAPFRLQPRHILFQDQYLIVLNKPAGVESQPTPARYKGTLYEALQFLLQQQGTRRPEIGMHQRLDRDTSGLLLFSLHPHSHKNIAKQLQVKTLHREYLALVEGIPEPAKSTIASFLARNRCTHKMVSVDNGGKEAITHYTTKESHTIAGERCALLAVTLATGRSHQIRAHLSEKGHPLIGDRLYGEVSSHHGKEYSRQCLHSYRLCLLHPKTGEKLRFEATPPQEMLP